MKNTDYPYHYSRMPEKETDRNILYQELSAQFEQDIRSNPLYDEFFAGYEDRVRPTAAHHLAMQKVKVLRMGKFLEKDENVMHNYLVRHLAEQVYQIILQKKLFNAQLLWRAGHIHLPQVYCTMHFQYWQEHILRCPFLEPVTDDEVEIMKRFLAQNEEFFTQSTTIYRWQMRSAYIFRDSERKIEGYPEFYAFYDREAGTEYLTELEDVIHKAEYRYMRVAWKHDSEQLRANTPVQTPPAGDEPDDADDDKKQPAPQPVNQPLKYVPDELFDEFIAGYEHKYIAYLHKRSRRRHEADKQHRYVDDDDEYHLGLAVHYLKYVAKPMYTAGGMLWYKDIIRCAALAQHDEIATDLDKVHHNDKVVREHRLRNAITNPDYSDCTNGKHIADHIATILRGRGLLGEPPNFDYLPHPPRQ
jgi:hypothetical protein